MIIVDSREPRNIRSQFDIVRELQYGDFLILVDDTRMLIERKTLTDFWSSLTSGRLNNQLVHCDVLLIEHVTLHEGRELNYERVYDALNGVSAHHPVLWSIDAIHTARIVRRIEDKLRKNEYGVMRTCVVDNMLSDKRLGLLCMFPGVGPERARLLMKKYGSLSDAIRNIHVWDEVIGVGIKTVESALEFMRDDSAVEELDGGVDSADK